MWISHKQNNKKTNEEKTRQKKPSKVTKNPLLIYFFCFVFSCFSLDSIDGEFLDLVFVRDPGLAGTRLRETFFISLSPSLSSPSLLNLSLIVSSILAIASCSHFVPFASLVSLLIFFVSILPLVFFPIHFVLNRIHRFFPSYFLSLRSFLSSPGHRGSGAAVAPTSRLLVELELDKFRHSAVISEPEPRQHDLSTLYMEYPSYRRTIIDRASMTSTRKRVLLFSFLCDFFFSPPRVHTLAPETCFLPFNHGLHTIPPDRRTARRAHWDVLVRRKVAHLAARVCLQTLAPRFGTRIGATQGSRNTIMSTMARARRRLCRKRKRSEPSN